MSGTGASTIAAAALALAALSGTIATATPAAADVLVNAEPGTIYLGQSMQVGVFYQEFSGGPRGYWEGVYSYPQRRWIFTKSGQASSAGFQLTNVRPQYRGEYATVYSADNHTSHSPVTGTFYTAVES